MVSTALQAQVANAPSLNEGEVRRALNGLKKRGANIPAANIDLATQVVLLLFEMKDELPQMKRRANNRMPDSWRESVQHMFINLTRQSFEEEVANSVKRGQGTGLGERVSLKEGRAGLKQYMNPGRLETWAGPVAGAGQLEHDMAIPRSTLSNWRRRHAVIGLLRGERKMAYPLEQFVDARPVQGLADVLKFAPDERAAWLWLRQRHPALENNTPLNALKAGSRDLVARAAESDFSIERDFA